VRWNRRLTRDEVEERLGTTGGFTIPLRPGRRTAPIWALLLLVISLLALVGGLPGGGEGVVFREVLQPFPASAPASGTPPAGAARIGRDIQETWRELFGRAGVGFRPAKLVVADRVRQSECGVTVPQAAEAFYCALDTTVSFSGGAGDAYLIAHAYAHHVQNVLGITEQIAKAAEASPRQARDLWLRHELQADCLAGVWAHSALPDATQTMQVASVPVNPDHAADVENWAAPNRAQRVDWFQRGFRGGEPSACNAFTT
jgi:uncharacterized protein